MVKGKVKPLEEITESIKKYKKVLNIGCGGCVSVCLAGGQREVIALNEELNLFFKNRNIDILIEGYTVERPCNNQYLIELDEIIPSYDCLISMACGAGVQHIAERYPDKPVFPALDTIAIGIDRDVGLYEERCRACGECVIGYTGGVCPVTRCAKGLYNGPCGGVLKDKCEVNADNYCAWVMIYNRLKEQDRIEDIINVRPATDWRNQVQRTIVQKKYEHRYNKR
ncbi:MAG: hypothetical protein HN931_09885 [Desulfobacterales bacterium]|jgi:ferredoxin|nr:hypothetical protein [Desulfobacteraceae bacterium]MBT4363722.1 hypothetical protein [Desulfobacteraceae bacterium]MBT7086469.1 hypothetical protein [Desulfobacterales bacterium]